MKRVLLFLIILSFLLGFAFAQEKEKSPMYYKGVDAGMSPAEVVKVLGQPTIVYDKEGKLSYYYSLVDGSSFSIFFHKKKWLSSIAITIRPAVHFKELGLTEEEGKGFKATVYESGAKIWRKMVDTEKYGKITFTYGPNPIIDKNLSMISMSSMTIADPTVFEK
jgi:hypothetical protein